MNLFAKVLGRLHSRLRRSAMEYKSTRAALAEVEQLLSGHTTYDTADHEVELELVLIMSVGKAVHSYTAQRVILSSPKPISEVIAALDEELNKANSGLAVLRVLATAQTKDDVDKGIGAMTEGKRDFMYVANNISSIASLLIFSSAASSLARPTPSG